MLYIQVSFIYSPVIHRRDSTCYCVSLLSVRKYSNTFNNLQNYTHIHLGHGRSLFHI